MIGNHNSGNACYYITVSITGTPKLGLKVVSNRCKLMPLNLCMSLSTIYIQASQSCNFGRFGTWSKHWHQIQVYACWECWDYKCSLKVFLSSGLYQGSYILWSLFILTDPVFRVTGSGHFYLILARFSSFQRAAVPLSDKMNAHLLHRQPYALLLRSVKWLQNKLNFITRF